MPCHQRCPWDVTALWVVPEGQEPCSARVGSREFCPCETSRGPSMEEPPGAASLPGWLGRSSPGAVSLLPGLSLSPPRLGAQSGQCVQPAPSAGGFPPAPASAALGSAPPSQTQARYCEVTLARLGASWKGCWLCGVGEGGHPSLGGQRVLPRIHPGMFSLQPLQSLHPAWHLPAARLGGHRSVKIVPLLTPRAEL